MIVAGERSGDIYGAALARALQARLPGVEVFGCGDEAMCQAAVDTVVDSHQISIAGITEVVHGIPRVYRAFHRLLQEVDQRQPQLAILIDFPDFNLRMARQLKKRRIPVVYFVSPQVWAWRKRRVRKLKERIAKQVARRWPHSGLLRGSSSGLVYGAAFAWPSNAGALIGGVTDAACRP